MKCLSLLFLLIFQGLFLSAQKMVMVRGVVKDSTGSPVIAASITIVTPQGAGISFTKTDQQGGFECRFQEPGERWSVKATALGYQPYILPVIQPNEQPYQIVMKAAKRELAAVTVKATAKIQLSSDTLKYNVNAFKDKNDRVVADLLKKLPGIEVDDKGAISYNGKRISNVYIDGDNLLGGRYNVATNNVPVNAIEQVQVIERDQPIKALNGFTVSNSVSLNLKLTDSAHIRTINTGQAGIGNNAYTAELNNLIFQRKIKSINNLKSNNVGQNLQNENASLGVSLNDNNPVLPSPQPYLSMTSDNLPVVDEKYYLRNTDHAGNINALLKMKSDWGLRLNVSTLQLKRKYDYTNVMNYFLATADTIRYNEIQHNVYKLNQWQVEAQLEKNSPSIYLKSITKLDIPKWNRTGNTTQNDEYFRQHLPSHQQMISNETSIIKILGTKDLFQYNSSIQYYKLAENLQIFPGLHTDIVNNNEPYLSLNQEVLSKSLFINQSATYKTKTDRLILSATAGISFERDRLASGLWKTDSLNAVHEAGSQFANNLSFENASLSGKLSAIYLLPKGAIIAEATPTYNSIRYGVKGTSEKYFTANPVFEFRKNLGRYAEINLRYAASTEFGQINDIYTGTILVNYREFSFNETPLPKTDRTSGSLRYTYRKPIKMFFYNLFLTVDQTKQNFITSYVIDRGITKATAMAFDNRQEKYSLNGNISKYLFFLALNLSGNASISYGKGNVFYNGEITPFNSYNTILGATLRKKIRQSISMSVTGEAGEIVNRQYTSKAITENVIGTGKIRAEWQHNLSSAVYYKLAYNFTSFRQSGQETIRNNFLDLDVRYIPAKWKSYFEVQCINLLGQSQYRQVTSGTNQLSVLQFPLRERTVLVKYVVSL